MYLQRGRKKIETHHLILSHTFPIDVITAYDPNKIWGIISQISRNPGRIGFIISSTWF